MEGILSSRDRPLFQKRLGIQKSKKEVTKVVTLSEVGENLSFVSNSFKEIMSFFWNKLAIEVIDEPTLKRETKSFQGLSR